MDYRTVYNDSGTGIAPVGAGAQQEAPIPQKEKVDQWFFEPLEKYEGPRRLHSDGYHVVAL